VRAATREITISTGKNMSFVRDLRVAAHSLIRTPGLAMPVVLTLSLGIGANAVIFTLVRGVLLKLLINRKQEVTEFISCLPTHPKSPEPRRTGGI
jgi:hypothetical protein